MRAALARAACLVPPALAGTWIIATSTPSYPVLAGSLAVGLVIAWAQAARMRTRLHTVASVLAAYRDGDYAIRARAGGAPELREALAELNGLGDVLRTHRLGELEAWTLLRKVLAEVDVVVVAVDDDGVVHLANDAAERLLGAGLVGKDVDALGLRELVTGDAPRSIPLAGSEWALRRGTFRLSGQPQTLLVLSDVSRSLREKEREAWQSLIRVMGHEINNSLSPIASISESLRARLDPALRDDEWEEDLAGGLGVIARRAEALGRFMNAYARLARLPPPRRAPTHVPTLVRKIAALETRAELTIADGPDLTAELDADQIEQVLINLVKNAAEASIAAGNRTVRLGWSEDGGVLAIVVEDEGPGVNETKNLFVPFFTTKPEGSGIGLVLSRQIVEAHDGQLTLAPRPDGPGACARVRVPLAPTPSPASSR